METEGSLMTTELAVPTALSVSGGFFESIELNRGIPTNVIA